MPKAIVTLSLSRKNPNQHWGFRIVGGVDEERLLKVDMVHGDGSPAGQAQLLANDAILFVDDKDVTEMKHPEVVQHIRSNRGLTMKMVVERGDHVIPSISEAFPNPDWPKEMTKEEKLAYFEMAMKKGIKGFLIPDSFSAVGKPKMKTPKYNSPIDLYAEDTLDKMVSDSTVDPAKFEPDSYADVKYRKSKKFDPKRSSVVEVMLAQEKGDFSVDKRAIVQDRKFYFNNE